jgi:hypothetical protein
MGALTNDDVGSRTTAIGYDALSSQNYSTATDTTTQQWAMTHVTTGVRGNTGVSITSGDRQ